MHMRDQQLYYHRLRMWLEDQLRQERESLPDSNVALVEDPPRRKRRPASPKAPRLNTAPKRKFKSGNTISKPQKILQLLKHKLPQTAQVTELDDSNGEAKPPEAFPLDKDVSDTETVVGEKDGDMCKDIKECLAKFANFALNQDKDVKYTESISPPLQVSPTAESLPVYSPKPNQRLLNVNKFLNKNDDGDEEIIEFQTDVTTDVINVPLNARRTPLLVKEESETDVTQVDNTDTVDNKDNVYKYVTFGLEIKKAMVECQNIINSYTVKEKDEEKDAKVKDETQESLSLEHICEVMMNLDKNAELLEKIDSDKSIDLTVANTKLAELVENMPQILANMPEIASKLSEFANTSFELPEFASIMSSIPDVNNEAQLSPETLKQIRELKLNKTRDSVKVTKNTAKRKKNRLKNNIDNDVTDNKEDEKEETKDENMQIIRKNCKEDFKELLFSISAQVVINKVFEYMKQNKNPEFIKCLEDGELGKNILAPEMYKDSTVFDNSVKEALSMEELRQLVRSRFRSWKQYISTKFKTIPMELLENEIETMLMKFQSYIKDLASKQNVNDKDIIKDKIDQLYKTLQDNDSDDERCAASKQSLKHITKSLCPQSGDTFDLLIMKLSKMTEDEKATVKNLKFKYTDVVKRCIESNQLINWILQNPELAVGVITEYTGLVINKPETVPDFTTMSVENKKNYFADRLKHMNGIFMQSLPKKTFTGDEWLVMLYRMEQLEENLQDIFSKIPPAKHSQASEAEILVAKGLSKIINKANAKTIKKTNTDTQKPVKKDVKEDIKDIPKDNEKDERKIKNDILLAKCEAILTSKGEKTLLDSFYTIKSYITQGLPVPETYKKHVISICSSIDAKLLDEEIEDSLKLKSDDDESKEKTQLSIGTQNPELLAKYSAQALRNAKQTLNAVAFRNMMKNGQSKSDSDTCDTPKSDCKWTNDCLCPNCKESDQSACLGGVKQCYDMDTKSKNGLEEKKKEKQKSLPKTNKPPPKVCENASHHVCKGHNAGIACPGENSPDQPCSCCYCTVFGHAVRKKQKLDPAVMAKVQLLTEQLTQINTFISTTTEDLQVAERQVAEASRRLQQCETELLEARAVQGKPDRPLQLYSPLWALAWSSNFFHLGLSLAKGTLVYLVQNFWYTCILSAK
ncbi:hypothetical protein RR46_00355 [Papilio xuthus]|uniref:Uncharacterized protein n=1 Tax=Papilio xuthus TaxID=66420 RepID=A0A0N1IN84_PAPXU|nr:hypothetical protein RR46_00355 [Papilio xuthus]